MSHFIGIGIFRIGLNRTDLGCWRLTLSESEAENLQNGDVHLAQIPDFEMEYIENHLRIEVSDGSISFSFSTLFHLSVTFFDRSFL